MPEALCQERWNECKMIVMGMAPPADNSPPPMTDNGYPDAPSGSVVSTVEETASPFRSKNNLNYDFINGWMSYETFSLGSISHPIASTSAAGGIRSCSTRRNTTSHAKTIRLQLPRSSSRRRASICL